jgi:hypothetical protein
MRQAPRNRLIAGGLLALALALGAPAADKLDLHPEDMLAWRERAVPGPAVTLRLKHLVGKALIYEGALKRTQQSASSYEEEDQFYLNTLCADQQEGRDLLAMWRAFTERKRIEKLENGKTIDRILENANDLINLGPNCSIVGALRCYAYDAQNRVAYRTGQVLTLEDGRQLHGTLVSRDEQKTVFVTDEDKLEFPSASVRDVADVPTPHVCINEAPHYLFPIFSARNVSPGETWRFRLPLIIPVEQGAAGRVLPTQFNAVLTGRLREVRQTKDGRLAIVDYHVSGLFDSDLDEFRQRLPAVFADNRILHKLTGDGTVSVDLDKGRIMTKIEDFTFVLYASSLVAPDDKAPKQVENQAEISSHFELKLLAPGTRLRSGAVVPPYE